MIIIAISKLLDFSTQCQLKIRFKLWKGESNTSNIRITFTHIILYRTFQFVQYVQIGWTSRASFGSTWSLLHFFDYYTFTSFYMLQVFMLFPHFICPCKNTCIDPRIQIIYPYPIGRLSTFELLCDKASRGRRIGRIRP